MSIQSQLIKSEKNMHQLSVITKIDHARLYRLKNGQVKEMTLSNAFKLADALGVDINKFREEEK
ncbi:helix-turn-helix domain-containing protein [Aerococcus urinae]|uniref:helix-turn-helix domain-containing protein n=1 Tax=Aerococcus urinae TaxID=1376 RepID=UPI002550907D|nr:helix-turn-helix domain-containing protein [Aerococcus urinae]MDK7716059.1 helix-turn-helix domain-containing protein [Aerococcus urinae]